MNNEDQETGAPVPGERVPITGQPIVWKSIDYPSIYANVFTMAITPVDISIVLGEIDYANPNEVVAKPRIKLILTPEHAATLMNGIGNGLGIFIQANGALRHNAFPPPQAEDPRLNEG